MATDKLEKAPPRSYVFDVESIPIPPGKKSRARLPRGMEPYPLPTRAWWLIGATAIVMLALGVLIGKFLLP